MLQDKICRRRSSEHDDVEDILSHAEEIATEDDMHYLKKLYGE